MEIHLMSSKDYHVTELDKTNSSYQFQDLLTPKLDIIDTDFNQDIINQIVLWKVNRYAELDKETLNELNLIDKTSESIDAELTRSILKKLINTKGIQLAMATTILRFKNPNIYQIIDQRVYRFITGKKLDCSKIKIDAQIEMYLAYLNSLKEYCIDQNVDFQLSDRILYAIDKIVNKDYKLKY